MIKEMREEIADHLLGKKSSDRAKLFIKTFPGSCPLCAFDRFSASRCKMKFPKIEHVCPDVLSLGSVGVA